MEVRRAVVWSMRALDRSSKGNMYCPRCSPFHTTVYNQSRLSRRPERRPRAANASQSMRGEMAERTPSYTPPWPTSENKVKYPWLGVEPPGSALGPNPIQPPLDNAASKVPVIIPHDPHSVIESGSGAAELLSNSALVIVRQLEPLNVFLGFEQANKYAILNPDGHHVGYLAEEETFGNTITRQLLSTSRPFRATVMNAQGEIVLRIRRPFVLINSKIYVHAGYSELPSTLIGLAQQHWHLWRRRYNLFLRRDTEESSSTSSMLDLYRGKVNDFVRNKALALGGGSASPNAEGKSTESSTQATERLKQFARIDSGLLSWDFYLEDENAGLLGTVNRNFSGFAREIFTDTGQYVLRFDAAKETSTSAEGTQDNAPVRGMTLDERAIALATGVSIDFDYFSRHSGSHGGFLPFFGSPFGGQTQTDEAAETNSTEEAGLPVERPTPPAPEAGGMLPGMMAGGMLDDQYSVGTGSGQSPGSPPPNGGSGGQLGQADSFDQDVWGEMNDPWASNDSTQSDGSWWGDWGGGDGGGGDGGFFDSDS